MGQVPAATVARLPLYLRALEELTARGAATVSSDVLAATAGTSADQVRKDVSRLGPCGTRGVGYDVQLLAALVRDELGLGEPRPVVLVGAGNLGRSLAGYGGFAARGFRVAAVVDADPAVVGTEVAGLRVQPVERLDAVLAATGARIGVLAVPAHAAQEVADALVAGGCCCLLTFAPGPLQVPDHVDVRGVDLATELQILGWHVHRTTAAGAPTTPTPAPRTADAASAS